MLQSSDSFNPKAGTPASNPNAYNPIKTVTAPVDQATIGRTLYIKGEVSGSEALYIDGRIEGKVTGQLSPKHSLVGSILRLTNKINNRCLAPACWTPETLSQPETQPQDLYSGNYNGIITNNFLLEAFASRSDIKFEHSGGIAGGLFDPTAVPTRSGVDGTFTGGSQFCATCGMEVRKSTTYGLKPHYFLSTPRAGAR